MKIVLYCSKKLTREEEHGIEDAITELAEEYPKIEECEFDYSKENTQSLEENS